MADQDTITLTRAQVEELRSIIHNADSPLGNRLQDVSARLYFALEGAGWTPPASAPCKSCEASFLVTPLLPVHGTNAAIEALAMRLAPESAHESTPVAAVAQPVAGDWLWGQLMGWCKKRGIAPANVNALFAIVGRARALAASPSCEQSAEWLRELLRRSMGYVKEASTRYYDGTDGASMRASAASLFKKIEAALSATPSPEALPAKQEGEYPPLPEAVHWFTVEYFNAPSEQEGFYTADEMRAYVDSDRASRAQAAPAAASGAVAYLMTRPSGTSWPLMPKDVTPEWRAVCASDQITITPLYAAPTGSESGEALSDAERSMLNFLFRQMGDLGDAEWRQHGFRRATFERLETKLAYLQSSQPNKGVSHG